MTTAIWPVDLPSPRPGFGKTPEDNIVPGVLDRGRRKFTKARSSYSVTFRFTASEYFIFDEFYRDGLHDGAEPFVWERPENAEAEIKFLLSDVQVQHVPESGGGDDALYDVAFMLTEVLG